MGDSLSAAGSYRKGTISLAHKCRYPVTRRNIHSKVLKRLAITWLVLSFLLGSIILFLQAKDIVKLILNLAVQDASTLTIACVNHFSADGSHDHKILRDEINKSLGKGFLLIKVYNKNKETVVEAVAPGKEAIEKNINKLTHIFPMDNSVHHHETIMDGQLYIQVLLPLQDNNGSNVGYFEGIYQTDDKTWKNIKSGLAHVMVTVVAGVLVTTAVLYPIIILLDKGIIKYSSDVLKGNIELMEVLGSAIAKRDSDTSIHNYRVTIYAIRLAEEELKLDCDTIRNLIAGAFLHDVGKIGVSDSILLKPSKLTHEEFETMKTHVPLGLDILNKSEWLKNGGDVVEYHHEKYDGSGYMKGLAGDSIPVVARIFAIVDVFDALTSTRPYKEPLSFSAAMSIMKKERETHFDPDIFDQFERIAQSLYNEIVFTDDKTIARLLDGLIEEYFFNCPCQETA